MLLCCSVILILLLSLQIVCIFKQYKELNLTCHTSLRLLKTVQKHSLLMEIKCAVILIWKIMHINALCNLNQMH